MGHTFASSNRTMQPGAATQTAFPTSVIHVRPGIGQLAICFTILGRCKNEQQISITTHRYITHFTLSPGWCTMTDSSAAANRVRFSSSGARSQYTRVLVCNSNKYSEMCEWDIWRGMNACARKYVSAWVLGYASKFANSPEFLACEFVVYIIIQMLVYLLLLSTSISFGYL